MVWKRSLHHKYQNGNEKKFTRLFSDLHLSKKNPDLLLLPILCRCVLVFEHYFHSTTSSLFIFGIILNTRLVCSKKQFKRNLINQSRPETCGDITAFALMGVELFTKKVPIPIEKTNFSRDLLRLTKTN